jgi:hypothetical protein
LDLAALGIARGFSILVASQDKSSALWHLNLTGQLIHRICTMEAADLTAFTQLGKSHLPHRYFALDAREVPALQSQNWLFAPFLLSCCARERTYDCRGDSNPTEHFCCVRELPLG